MSRPPISSNHPTPSKQRTYEDNPKLETPKSKRSKQEDRFVGCCTCSQKSKCSNARCVCRKAGIVCTLCRSSCCSNKALETPKPHLHSASSTMPTDYGIEKTSTPHADAGAIKETSSKSQQNKYLKKILQSRRQTRTLLYKHLLLYLTKIVPIYDQRIVFSPLITSSQARNIMTHPLGT